MNHKIRLTVAAMSVLVFVFGGLAPVLAHDGEEHEPETTLIAQQSNGQLTEEQLKQLDERLKKRKEALKLRLTNTEKVRIENRCKAAQGNLKSLEGRIQGIKTSRTHVYSNLTQRLTKLRDKLAAKGIDTIQLNGAIADLEKKTTEFNDALADYIQAVTDLAIMQCSSDAEGFKASLERARQLQGELRDKALAIKSLLNDTIKPLLVEMRSQLAETSSSDSAGGNE